MKIPKSKIPECIKMLFQNMISHDDENMFIQNVDKPVLQKQLKTDARKMNKKMRAQIHINWFSQNTKTSFYS